MCGIVGAIAQRNVVPILVEGLRRLEYRGYDSAGVAVLEDGPDRNLIRVRAPGKVAQLVERLDAMPRSAQLGIAHTRWATDGGPTEANAHPHICNEQVAVVHNGIIENHAELRSDLVQAGYKFTSETDTEVIAHRIHYYLEQDMHLADVVRAATADFQGAYALGVISRDEPGRIIVARWGSPLVVGIGVGEHFIASDVAALIPVTQQFIFLEDGDIADVRAGEVQVRDAYHQPASRKPQDRD